MGQIQGTPLRNGKYKFWYSYRSPWQNLWISYNEFTIAVKETDDRISWARDSFPQYRTLLQNQNFNLKALDMIINSLVKSKLSYGCNAWCQTRSQILKLSAACLSDKHISSCLVDCGYIITRKKYVWSNSNHISWGH